LDLNIFSNYEERTRLTEEVIKNGFIYDSECHFRRKNGDIILCLISIVKVIIGHNAYFLSSILNISERKLSEIRLQKLTEELKSSNIAKDKFFSIISHDLKNPFHSINAALKLLLSEEDSFTSDERNVFLRSILTTSERAYSLLENLLLWSREQMGNIEFEPEMIEIMEIVIESIKHLEQNAALKNITITSSVKNNIFVKADRNMIEIVLRNLLANAIKFTGDKGKINIEAFESDGYVRITVIDNGTGILTEDIGKLFRIDHLFSTRGTKGEEGTGLGLIICKDFIEKNEGKIWVESEFGKGSKFTFELPKRKSNK
jgi:signal transduction histidine kinase